VGRGVPDPAIEILVSVLVGYLAGSLPFGYWLVRFGKGVDIRTVGSGNMGASNVWRTYGTKYGLTVTVLDVAKGFVPAFLATMYVSKLAGVLAGLAAMLGHARPLFLRFRKGGKMVATGGGAFLGVAPLPGVICLGIWVVVFLATRYPSVASIVTAVAVVVLTVAFGEPWPVIAFAAVAAVAVIVLHRANLKRLRAGTENRATLPFRRTSGSGA
jgi:acyl phosphate:glycerol-3-phosphate acyltransferase